MNRDVSGRTSVIAAVMVGAGALLSGGIVWGLAFAGVGVFPRIFFLQDPVGWAVGPRVEPLGLVAMLIALVLLMAATWLFVRLVVRAAAPGRAAAVFFGTWGAIIIASWIAGLVRSPIVITSFRLPADNSELIVSQFYQLSTMGVAWGLTWGWLTALVVALVHAAATRTPPVAPGADPRGAYQAPGAPQSPAEPPAGPQASSPPLS